MVADEARGVELLEAGEVLGEVVAVRFAAIRIAERNIPDGDIRLDPAMGVGDLGQDGLNIGG